MNSNLAILVLCITATSGFVFGGNKGPEWHSLRTTWGANPFSSNYFVNQPLTVDAAKDAGYAQIPGACNGKFLGQRFMKGSDVSLILIYDSKGDIAGTQMAIPTSILTKYYNFTQQKMYNEDNIGGVDVLVLTAYFINPSTICQSSEPIVRNLGVVGTGLWLQNGTDPVRDSFQSPIEQSEVNSTKWVQGACFPSMGVHYWYDNRLDLDCNLFFPAFLMYNKGTLTGFGWANVGKYDYTKHAEYPPLSALSSFLVPVPTCMPEWFDKSGGFTTMHVYFNSQPWNLLC